VRFELFTSSLHHLTIVLSCGWEKKLMNRKNFLLFCDTQTFE
jgi:hypothetical protein